MAKISEAKLRAGVRDVYLAKVREHFTNDGEDVLTIANNSIAFPVTDDNGNEYFVKVVVSVPTGSRDDKEPFDGYAVAEQHKMNLEAKAAKKAKAAEEKARKIARDKARREKNSEN